MVFWTILLWLLFLGTGLMAGVYFAFSVFVMRARAAAGPTPGMTAMQSINRVILTSGFMPLFWGTSAGAALAAALAVFVGGNGASLVVTGGLVYVLGMFGVTVARNVPMNQRLDKADAVTEEGRAVWEDYCRDWTLWNHLRTMSSLLASGLFAGALA